MCLNSSSASVACPFFIIFNAAAYCCSACGGTGTVAGTGAVLAGVPAAAVALAAGVPSPWALADDLEGAAGRASSVTAALAAGGLFEAGAAAAAVALLLGAA